MEYGIYSFENYDFYVVMEDGSVRFISNMKNDFLKRYPDAIRNDASCQTAINQLDEYFNGNRTEFELDLKPTGTPFQESVWDALLTLTHGDVVTYSDIATIIGDPKKVRAAANAIGKNPIMIVIPCHRVIGKDGKLHGFGGGVDLKIKLLELER